MLKYYIQLVAVLGMVIFLAAGCGSFISKPYDFRTMWQIEQSLGLSPSMNQNQPFYTPERHGQIDQVYSYYYAGQVAFANGDFTKADKFFAKALEIFNLIKGEVKAGIRKELGFVPGQTL